MLSPAAPLRAFEEQHFGAPAGSGAHDPDQRFQAHAGASLVEKVW
jgi:hypothetical protein